MIECPRCLKRAFVWTYDGKKRCVNCCPYEETDD